MVVFIPEILAELGEAAAGAYRIYRAARAAASAARAAKQLADAAKAAQALQSKAEVKGCATCPKEAVPCFNTPPGGDDAEMDRQLKEQQDAINKMSPDELLNNMKNNRGPDGRIARPPDDANVRRDGRITAQNRKEVELGRQYLSQGQSPSDAKQNALRDAARYMEGKQMLHTPDFAAGGDGTLSPTPGDATTNRSIGSQWVKGTDAQGRTRADVLQQEAANAKARGDTKMDVELERCKNSS